MSLTRTVLSAAAALALMIPLAGKEVAAQYKAEYTVSTVLPAPFPWGVTAEEWARLVDERSEGRIKLKVYPGAQLVSGDQTKELTAMRQGIIDMAVGSTINWSPQIKELNLFALPFLMPDYAALDALTQGPVGERIFEIVERNGVVPLAWAENGFREISNSKVDIRSPEDMAGLKIRVVGSPLFLDTFTALGANPTQMSWADALPALGTGAVDGQENPLTVYMASRLYESGQTHVTLWHYIADPLIFAVNRRIWESFSPEDQELLRQAAIDAGKYGIEVARKGLTGDDPTLVRELEEAGVTVTSLTEEERAAFVEATRPIYEKWREEIGADLVDLAEKSIAERAR